MNIFIQVQASFTLTLLQNDIKTAMKSAFGTMEGPLSVVDWCKGRSQSNDGGISGDGFSAESTASASECRDSSSTISFSVGEPISPSQSSAGGSSLKGVNYHGHTVNYPAMGFDKILFCFRWN